MSKKAAKSLKEKRAEKRAKSEEADKPAIPPPTRRR